MLSITRWPWSSPLIYCLPGPAWASTEGKWSMRCCSWPRLQLWNLRPGSKCCQKIGHRGARAREYPSFPSSGWDEILWWECIHGDEGLFQSTVQEFSQSLQGWQGRNLIQLVTCSPEHRENACLPACQCPAHLLPSSVTQDPSPENSAAAVGWVSPHGFPYKDKHLWKCPHD